ncbi:MAG: metallophosphoesterase family protein [Bacillota bacterium]|nr:metallophosphoesterase family protein [Bacillota bacterium]
MNIAVLSDIHGNLPALNAVLNDIQNKNIDKILVAGDHITDFPEINEILQTLQELTPYVIKGNREQLLIENAKDSFGNDWEIYDQFSSHAAAFRLLKPKELSYIQSMPEQISLDIDEDFSIRMVHGSPFDMSEAIYEHDVDLMMRCTGAISEKLLICGHTHRPMLKYVGEKIILNPGSVGVSYCGNTTAQYIIIRYNADGLKFEMREIQYDFSELQKACKAALKDGYSKIWLSLLLRSVKDGKDYNFAFLNEVMKNTEKHGIQTFPIPNDMWNKTYDSWAVKDPLFLNVI